MTALLASLERTDAAKATTDYLASVGKLTRALDSKKRAMNVTPAAPKPYCRHKQFSRMPKYSLDAVSLSFL